MKVMIVSTWNGLIRIVLLMIAREVDVVSHDYVGQGGTGVCIANLALNTVLLGHGWTFACSDVGSTWIGQKVKDEKV